MASLKIFLILALTCVLYQVSAEQAEQAEQAPTTTEESTTATEPQTPATEAARAEPQRPERNDPNKNTVTITVKGSANWQQSVTVKKGSQGHKWRGHHGKKHFSFRCCNAPTNLTSDYSLITAVQKCHHKVMNIFRKNGTQRIRPSQHIKLINCFMECVSQKLELSNKAGVIKTEAMVDFMMSDKRMELLGINREQIRACVTVSKNISPNKPAPPPEGGDVCNLSNYEHLRFIGCMIHLENMNCPAEYQNHNPQCNKYREYLQKRK